MGTVSKKFGFIRATLAMWTGNLFAGRAGVVTDSTPGPVERWGWWDGSAWKFSARSGASETFSDVVLSNLTVNNLPRLDANKKTVASCFGDDGTTGTCSRPLTLNGAIRPAWGGGLLSTDIGGMASIYAAPVDGGMALALNYYYDGSTNRSRFAGAGTNYPCQLSINPDGSLRFTVDDGGTYTDGGVIRAFVDRVRFSRQGGIGFYGIAAPSSRPAVTGSRGGNAALASLLTALNACGLITDSTTA